MIVELKTNKATAVIDTIGAQLVSFRDNTDTEYIWQRNPDIWRNCSPILFPIVGGCRNNQTIIEGRSFEIPKHGPTKSTEFHLKQNTRDFAAFEITQDDFPTDCFPYAFHLTVSYQLTEQNLSLILEVENPSDSLISYCIGLHPGFRCPFHEEERFEDYVLRFGQEQKTGYRRYDTEKQQYDMSAEYPFPGIGTDIPLSHHLFIHDAIWFDRPTSSQVSLINPTTGHGISTSFADFETVAFWTLPSEDAQFVCIEPWNGSAICSDEDDNFEHKNHLQHLAPTASRSYTMLFSIV